jgi:hypothetical protein
VPFRLRSPVPRRDAGDDQYPPSSAVARVDRGFARLAGLFGIKDRCAL